MYEFLRVLFFCFCGVWCVVCVVCMSVGFSWFEKQIVVSVQETSWCVYCMCVLFKFIIHTSIHKVEVSLVICINSRGLFNVFLAISFQTNKPSGQQPISEQTLSPLLISSHTKALTPKRVVLIWINWCHNVAAKVHQSLKMCR